MFSTYSYNSIIYFHSTYNNRTRSLLHSLLDFVVLLCHPLVFICTHSLYQFFSLTFYFIILHSETGILLCTILNGSMYTNNDFSLLFNFFFFVYANVVNKVKIIFVYIDKYCHVFLLCTFLIELLFSVVDVQPCLLRYILNEN
jgi:hypothetical protein